MKFIDRNSILQNNKWIILYLHEFLTNVNCSDNDLFKCFVSLGFRITYLKCDHFFMLLKLGRNSLWCVQ